MLVAASNVSPMFKVYGLHKIKKIVYQNKKCPRKGKVTVLISITCTEHYRYPVRLDIFYYFFWSYFVFFQASQLYLLNFKH